MMDVTVCVFVLLPSVTGEKVHVAEAQPRCYNFMRAIPGGDEMGDKEELLALLDRHLRSIWQGDLDTYRATTAPEVTFYEWYISTQRIDGLDFHLREIEANMRAKGAAAETGQWREVDHEVLAPHIQFYGDIAIITYTLSMRYTGAAGVTHTEHNETRAFHRRDGRWVLVHCHKSPMWPAPHTPR
jgi:hypothetical protein